MRIKVNAVRLFGGFDGAGLGPDGPDSAIGRFDVCEKPASVTCPALGVDGDRDPIVPSAFMKTNRHGPSCATTAHHLKKDASHFPQFDALDVYIGTLRDFTERQSAND